MTRRILFAALLIGILTTAAAAPAADLLVVDVGMRRAFFGFYGSPQFADQPEALWDNTVAWAVNNSAPASTDVLLYTYDGTVNDCAPQNVNSIGFYNLLRTAGYNVQLDSRGNFAKRTSYSGFELVVFPNFGYSDALAPRADNVIASGLPFITMEPGQSDELNIGTGVTVFSGTVQYGLVVDNGHVITQEFGLGTAIPMAQKGFEAFVFDIPTDGITTAGNGRVLIGEVPEPATLALVGTAAIAGLGILRRRHGRHRRK